VRGDRDLLLEAVANLVDNAVKFTPAGGSVKLVLIHGKDESIVRVSDTGPGIQECERSAVTRRFYRADKSRNSFGFWPWSEPGLSDRQAARLPVHDSKRSRLRG
jgi:signal transduction histidine kinase